MMQVFPVSLVESSEPQVIEAGPRAGKPCPVDRIWYRDTHDAGRGGIDPQTRRYRFRHEAQDIFAPAGSLVLAPEPGVIVGSSKQRGMSPKGGHWLVLEVRNPRGQPVRSYYMSHLLETPPAIGTEVEAGEPIGKVGNTGNARTTCPHLHIGASRYGRRGVGPDGPGRRGGRAIQLFAELQAVDPTKGPIPRDRPAGKETPASSSPSPSEPDCKPSERVEGELEERTTEERLEELRELRNELLAGMATWLEAMREIATELDLEDPPSAERPTLEVVASGSSSSSDSSPSDSESDDDAGEERAQEAKGANGAR